MTYINNFPIHFNIPKIAFKSNNATFSPVINPIKDGFVSNPMEGIGWSKAEIESEAKSNPRIMEIMKKYNLPVKANVNELENLRTGHLKDTRVTAAKIYSALPKELKSEANMADIQQAAMFHDYGKVLIPDKILNKQGVLTEQEREIISQHSELGYELLKNKGLNKNTLNLIKYHHQTPNGTGYPASGADFEYGLDSEILAAADKYTALREKRSYKNEMSHSEALEVMRDDISKDVYNALERMV